MSDDGKHRSSKIGTFLDFLESMDDSQQALLKGTIVIEDMLKALISERLEVPEAINFEQLSFNSRVQLAVALGVLPQESIKAYKALYNARSRHAHSLHDPVSVEDIFKLASKLSVDQQKRYTFQTFDSMIEAHRKGAELSPLFLAREFVSHLYSELIEALAIYAPKASQAHMDETQRGRGFIRKIADD